MAYKAKNPRKNLEAKFDIRTLDSLLMMHCTAEECAAVFEMSVDVLERRVKELTGENFAVYSKAKKAVGKMSLRRAQYVTATQQKNPTMLIWLGKNLLDQKDRQELTGKDGAPLIPAQHATNYDALSVHERKQLHVLLKKAKDATPS